MKPQLRPDAYFAAVPDGAYWLTNRGPVLLTGRGITEWVERLSPFLDGQRSLDELTSRLAQDQAAFVSKVVHALYEQGIVKDVTGEQLSAEPASSPHPAELRFIDYFRDSAAARFERYRASRALLIGAGPSLIACLAAARRSGLSEVRVAVTDDCTTDLDRLGDVDHLLIDTQEENRLPELLTDAHVVVHVTHQAGMSRARMLARACEHTDTLLAQVITVGTGAWIGPLPLSGEVSWEAVWRRISQEPPEDQPPEISPAAAAALAAQLFHRLFREVTGLVESEDNQSLMSRLDLLDLRTTTHRVLPHPYARPARARTAAEFRQAIDTLHRGPRLDAETFSRRAATLVDERLGPFLRIGEGHFSQVPLHVCEVTVADPIGMPARRAPVSRIAGGPDFATARYRAALHGFVAYCARFIDPRRLLTAENTWGLRLTDDEPCLVPVESAFPAVSTRSAGDVTPVGAAAGYDWADAVTAGLVDWGREVTIAALPISGQPLSTVDVENAGLDDVGYRYRRLLAELNEPLVVYDITGSLGLPTFAFCLGTSPVRYTSAPQAADALRDGLEKTLLPRQAQLSAPPLPESLRGDGTPGRLLPPDIDVPTLVKALHRDGWVPIAVPLDHDPEITRIMPYVVQVVLTRV